MDPDDLKHIEEHLAKYGAHCPICASSQLRPMEKAVLVPYLDNSQNPFVISPNDGYPALLVECVDCGHVLFFSTKKIGLDSE